MLFSVIIPTFNRPNSMVRAVRSCLSQTYRNFEVIVCDDGSSEDYTTALSGIRDARVRYVRMDENAGKIAAILRGQELVSGAFVAFLDDDDEWRPSHLANLASVIAAAGEAARQTLFYTKVEIIRGKGRSTFRPRAAKAPSDTFVEYIVKRGGLMQNSGICLPRELLAKFKFDPAVRKHVDYEICQWAEHAGAHFIFVPDPTAVWHCEPASGRLSKSKIGASRAWLEHWRARGVTFGSDLEEAFIAFHVAPLVALTDLRSALALLGRAAAKGYVSWPLIARTLSAAFARSRRGRLELATS